MGKSSLISGVAWVVRAREQGNSAYNAVGGFRVSIHLKDSRLEHQSMLAFLNNTPISHHFFSL